MAGSEILAKLQRQAWSLASSLPPDYQLRVYSLEANRPLMAWSSAPPRKEAALELAVRTCQKRLRTVVIHDAYKDYALSDAPKSETFRSGICIPLLGSGESLVGFLVLYCSTPGAFRPEARYDWERKAQPIIQTLDQAQSQPDDKPPTPSPFSFLHSRAILASAVVLVLGLIFWASAPDPHTPVARQTAGPRSTVGPGETARTFALDLQKGLYDDAWSSLAPSLRRFWSSEQFRSQIETWLSTSANAEVFSSRTVTQLQRDGNKAKAIFHPSSVPGDQGVWVWEMELSEERWMITAISGGPVASPNSN